MYGKDGDIIDGRYLIVKIGTESIEMTHADGRGRQVIRLTGQSESTVECDKRIR